LTVKTTTFPYHDIPNRIWTSPDKITHNQTDIFTKEHVSMTGVLSHGQPDCDTNIIQ